MRVASCSTHSFFGFGDEAAAFAFGGEAVALGGLPAFKGKVAAAVSAYLSGLPVEIALRSLSFLSAIEGRMQPFYGHPKDALIVIDYAHTPDALEQVLLSLKKQTEKQVHVVFGCGGQRDKGKRILMGEVARQLADKIIITDDNPRNETPETIRAEIMAGCPDAIAVSYKHLTLPTTPYE